MHQLTKFLMLSLANISVVAKCDSSSCFFFPDFSFSSLLSLPEAEVCPLYPGTKTTEDLLQNNWSAFGVRPQPTVGTTSFTQRTQAEVEQEQELFFYLDKVEEWKEKQRQETGKRFIFFTHFIFRPLCE